MQQVPDGFRTKCSLCGEKVKVYVKLFPEGVRPVIYLCKPCAEEHSLVSPGSKQLLKGVGTGEIRDPLMKV